MALRGIKVIELPGTMLGPFCGLFLSDFGATVIRIHKIGSTKNSDLLTNGKQSIALNLEDKEGNNIFKKLCNTSDVLIDTYRHAKMESLGLGPNILLKENPKLIYARLSGYGQNGLYANRPAHSINVLALTGLLSILKDSKPQIPQHLLACIGSSASICVLGIITALFERTHSGKGQIIDANMVDSIAYSGSWIYRSQILPFWKEYILNADNIPFYGIYETKDGKYMSVGAIKPKFYNILLKALNLTENECPQFGNREIVKNILTKKFLEKTQAEWCNIFDTIDACVTPVLNFKQALHHPHNSERKTFTEQECVIPAAAPRLSRTPAEPHARKPHIEVGQHTESILQGLGYTDKEINQLEVDGVIAKNLDSKM